MDDFLPEFDFEESHEIFVDGTPDQAYRTFEELDYAQSKVLRFLFFLRGISTANSLRRMFIPLLRNVPNRHVEGLIAKPWTISGGVRKMSPEEFAAFAEPGYAKVVWEFTFEKEGEGCLVKTVTRIKCTDSSSRRKFSCYWFFVRPFSGLVRRIMLKMIKVNQQADRVDHEK